MTAYGTLYSGRPEQFSDTEREFLKDMDGDFPPASVWVGQYLPDGICGKTGIEGKIICGGRLVGNGIHGYMCERCQTIYYPKLGEFLKSVSGYVPQFKHDRPILGKEEK